jgi:hypothetical protein
MLEVSDYRKAFKCVSRKLGNIMNCVSSKRLGKQKFVEKFFEKRE